jgi:hypothetical protein
MVSNLKYFSFKETELYRRQPFWVLIGVIVLLKLFIAEPQVMLFLSFLLYASSGPLRWAWVRGRRLRGRMRRRGKVVPFSGGSLDVQTPPPKRRLGLARRRDGTAP